MKKLLLNILVLGAFLGSMEAASSQGWINPFLIPAPSRVVAAAGRMIADGSLASHVVASLERVLCGFAISVITAIPLGLLVASSARFRIILSPLLGLLRPIPPLAWIPLAILWFGLGNGPSYFVTMIASFFPIFLNTVAGVDGLDPEHRDVARTLGASRRLMLTDVVLPSAAPFIFSGLRIGLGFAWMSVIAAEIVSATSGLGFVIEINQEMLRIEPVVVGMGAIGVLGVILDRAMLASRKLLVRW